jgi:asparagine synthase (glutamine-hydrolysing)
VTTLVPAWRTLGWNLAQRGSPARERPQSCKLYFARCGLRDRLQFDATRRAEVAVRAVLYGRALSTVEARSRAGSLSRSWWPDMCGIAGWLAPRRPDRSRSKVAQSIAHRGPDGDGFLEDGGEDWSLGLAHSRLAVLDPSSAAQQPMTRCDDSLSIAYNGELYNYPDLRRLVEARGHRLTSESDTEALLHLWEDEGVSCLDRLEGIFAFAVWSGKTKTITLGRDPIGVKPLFWSTMPDGGYAFGSEPLVVSKLAGRETELDVVAAAQFLSFLWVPPPRTPLVHIKHVPAEETIVLDLVGEPKVCRRTRFIVPDPAELAAGKIPSIGEVRERVVAAVQRQTLSDIKVGAMVSGGIDSTVIWSAARESLDSVYSIRSSPTNGVEGIHQDFQTVVRLAEEIRTELVPVGAEIVGEQDTIPRGGDLFACPSFPLTKAIASTSSADGVRVLLSGQGGDEAFGGYRRHLVARAFSLPAPARRLAAQSIRVGQRTPFTSGHLNDEYAQRLKTALAQADAFQGYMSLCTYSTPADRADALGTTEMEVSDEVVWSTHREVFDAIPSSLSFYRRCVVLDQALYLQGIGLAQADRAGMEEGVEVRVPLLDMELLRWLRGLPDAALSRRGKSKWLLRAVAREEFGKWVADRPKTGFSVPVEDLRPRATDGRRGYRQGRYFARAADVLSTYRQRNAV